MKILIKIKLRIYTFDHIIKKQSDNLTQNTIMEIKTYKLEEQDRYVDFRSYADGIWFGDPCYVVPDGFNHDTKNYWESLVNMMYTKETFTHPDGTENCIRHTETLDSQNEIRVVEVDDEKFYMWSTAFGDGCYPLTLNNKLVDKLGVDAGCLSVVPMKLINLWGISTEEAKRLGYIHEGPGNAGWMSVELGDFHWNNWDLLTGPNHDEDEEDEEEYWNEG